MQTRIATAGTSPFAFRLVNVVTKQTTRPTLSQYDDRRPLFALPRDVVKIAHSRIEFGSHAVAKSMGGSVMIDAANYSVTETLGDGRTITIRAQRPEDLDGWRAALARTSAETRYFRFFAAKSEVSEKEAHYLLDIDFVKHFALVAVADEDGRPTLIGGGRYYRRRTRQGRDRLRAYRRISGQGDWLRADTTSSGDRTGGRLARTGGGGPFGQPSDAKGL